MVQRFTTVTEAAETYDLIDLDTAKAELKIDDSSTGQDEWIEEAITEISGAIRTKCFRVFQTESLTDTFYETAGASPLQLRRFPVSAISSVTEDGTSLIQGTDFLLDAEAGHLQRLYCGRLSSWFCEPVIVSYSAGYDAGSIPPEVKQAALRLFTMRFKGRGRDAMLMSQEGSGPQGGQRFWVGPQPGQDGAFPPEIEALLDPYIDKAFF